MYIFRLVVTCHLIQYCVKANYEQIKTYECVIKLHKTKKKQKKIEIHTHNKYGIIHLQVNHELCYPINWHLQVQTMLYANVDHVILVYIKV